MEIRSSGTTERPSKGHESLNAVGGLRHGFVLPNAKGNPSGCSQGPIYGAIAVLISFEFRAPEPGIGFGPRCVLWADVPEASIDVHGDPFGGKDEVRFGSYETASQETVKPESESAGM